nr:MULTISPECIES: hypothetical protein [unclassified Caballeronia]
MKEFGINHVHSARFKFLPGLFCYPQYYLEKMGHANMRVIPEHLRIGPAEVEAWLTCMKKAIADVGFHADVNAKLMLHFTRSATALKNKLR